jgi:hypothetical protein
MAKYVGATFLRLVLKYAKGGPVEGWRYRRVVPERLRTLIGKREFKVFLGQTEAEAVRAYAGHLGLVRALMLSAKALS